MTSDWWRMACAGAGLFLLAEATVGRDFLDCERSLAWLRPVEYE